LENRKVGASPPTSKRVNAKWGFGMSPISDGMRRRYDAAVESVSDWLAESRSGGVPSADAVSELKGMFNRCVREDQWDWFTLHLELGQPSKRDMKELVALLIGLRAAIQAESESQVREIAVELGGSNLMYYLRHYRERLPGSSEGSSGVGWLYVLSTRENPRLLKVGMTRRSVDERVNEINSATGVVIPYSARRAYRVADPATAEREVHRLLHTFRVRSDREFFELSIGDASKIIGDYLAGIEGRARHRGEVKWFNPEKGFGFIESAAGDVFLHESQVDQDQVGQLVPGCAVDFDIAPRPKGNAAERVRLLVTGE